MDKFSLKTPQEVEIMKEGGALLRQIREGIVAMIKPGITTLDLENKAMELIIKAGGKPSFAMVPGYHHATCINVNEVVVHGMPSKRVINDGDKVGVDVGLFYKGFHTDTSDSVIAGNNKDKEIFLEVGRRALKLAIKAARPGKRVMDISMAMESTVEAAGFSVVTALTGHGIGKHLHEEPPIPCFVVGKYEHSPILTPGMVIAIEIMYNEGKSEVIYKNDDGWTIATADGKISGLFEHTVAVTKSGPVVIT